MHPNAPTVTILVVTKTKMVSGDVIRINKIETTTKLPWRVGRRYKVAYDMGLEYVRAMGTPKPLKQDEAGIIAVTVTDGKRALCNWRRMEHLSGFTGTHQVHPMVTMSGIK